MINVVYFLLAIGGLWLLYRWGIKREAHGEKLVAKILTEYGITIPELTGYNCTYVGGHPDQNWEITHVMIGAKNGKLIFFHGAYFNYKEEQLAPRNVAANNKLLFKGYDALVKERSPIGVTPKGFKHLFDIPISSITGIQHIDETARSTKGVLGTSVAGVVVGVPIKTKDAKAYVIIDWVDGNISHSTELRITEHDANGKANALRNVLLKMIK
jgi:hypothetical protein